MKTTYKGIEVYKLTHWVQGPVLLQTLNILENFDIGALEHGSAEHLRIVAEAMKRATIDKDAKVDRIRLIRSDQGTKVSWEYDLNDILKRRPEEDVQLKPGDQVLVPEKGSITKRMGGRERVLPWVGFLISLGLVLGFLI